MSKSLPDSSTQPIILLKRLVWESELVLTRCGRYPDLESFSLLPKLVRLAKTMADVNEEVDGKQIQGLREERKSFVSQISALLGSSVTIVAGKTSSKTTSVSLNNNMPPDRQRCHPCHAIGSSRGCLTDGPGRDWSKYADTARSSARFNSSFVYVTIV